MVCPSYAAFPVLLKGLTGGWSKCPREVAVFRKAIHDNPTAHRKRLEGRVLQTRRGGLGLWVLESQVWLA